MNFYVLKAGQVLGPFTSDQVRSQLSAGTIAVSDSFAVEGDSAWKSLGEFPAASPSAPPPVQLPPPVASRVYHADPHAIPPAAAGATSNLAISALVAGILSFFCGIGSVVAIVLGHMALGEIKRTPGLQGREMALIGLILGYVVLGLFVVGVGAYILLIILGSQMPAIFPSH